VYCAYSVNACLPSLARHHSLIVLGTWAIRLNKIEALPLWSLHLVQETDETRKHQLLSGAISTVLKAERMS
jgi:hypothetical protein